MSAKQAADALLDCDVQLFEFAKKKQRIYTPEWGAQVRDFMTEYVAGTWTLTLAAGAANAEEQQVVAALFYRLGCGSTVVCRRLAQELLS